MNKASQRCLDRGKRGLDVTKGSGTPSPLVFHYSTALALKWRRVLEAYVACHPIGALLVNDNAI